MKKIYLISFSLLFSLFSLAQSNSLFSKKELTHKNSPHSYKSNVDAANEKDIAQVIWSDDFSNASNWTLSQQAGNDSWVIGTSGPSGSFPLDPIASATAANGYAMFDSDALCGGNQIADLTTANSIDLSSYPAVILEYSQFYRRFYDSTFVFISTNGTSWSKIVVNQPLANNDATTNPELVSLNISTLAGGQATVWIRFEFYSPSSMGQLAGCAYAWMIDDVSISSAPDNNMVIGQVIHSEYTQIPLTQAQDINFSAYATNNGGTIQTNVSLNVKVNSTAFDQSSTPANVGIGATDSLYLTQGFLPTAVGDYTVAFNVMQDQTDASPENNADTGSFTVTEFVYARDDDFYTGAAYGYPGHSFEIANYYQIVQEVTAVSITSSIVTADNATQTVRVKLYSIDGTGTTTEVAASDYYDVTLAQQAKDADLGDSPTTFTVNFITPAVLTPGDYYASLENAADTTHGLYIVSGTDLYQAHGTTVIDEDVEDNLPGNFEFYVTYTPLIRLNMEGFVGIEEKASLVKNISVQPNPASNITTISYSLDEAVNHMNVLVYDITGQLVMSQNMGNRPAGSQSFKLDVSGLTPGIYSCSMIGDNSKSFTTKIVVVK